jgi:hypothetical protein
VESFDAKFPLYHCEVQHTVAICVRLHTICVYTLQIRNYPPPIVMLSEAKHLCLFFPPVIAVSQSPELAKGHVSKRGNPFLCHA